ncbi:MAG: hypothetical protein JF619_27590 [Massilia sp.]|nr:hypothetical protein [Massilia sp.]
MKLRTFVLLLALLCTCVASAQEPARLMQDMAGVYKQRWMSATITPGKAPGEADVPYQAEDVIEIVPYDADHVYVRAHLDFYNGHTCDIAGMGRYEQGAFVYHDPERLAPEEPPCVLKVSVEGGKLTLTDRAAPDAPESCRTYCGARGALEYAIGMDKRRPIRYLDRLRASRQYRQAVDDMYKTEPATADDAAR